MDTVGSKKKDDLEQAAEKIEILILGNSHATYGVNPEKFDRYAYNMAQPNQSLYFDKRITEKYLDDLKNLKLVLISIDYHSLYFSSQGPRDGWSYYNFGIDYKNTLSFGMKHFHLLSYPSKMTVSLVKKKFGGNYKTIKALDVEDAVFLDTVFSKGYYYTFITDYKEMNRQKYKERANAFNSTVKNSKEYSDIMADLEEFIITLKRRNIQPVLITLPCYKDFREFLIPYVVRKNNKDVTALSKKYNIQYVNLFDLDFDETFYLNCDHLNKKGADSVSKIINQRLKI